MSTLTWIPVGLAAWVLVPLPIAVAVGRVFARGSEPVPVEADPVPAPVDRLPVVPDPPAPRVIPAPRSSRERTTAGVRPR